MSEEPAIQRSTAFERDGVPKRSEALMAGLRDQILSGELPAGSMLPPERQLVADTGFSRMAVREALRLLESEGLLTIRAGRAGGAMVRRPDGTDVARHLDIFIDSQEVSLETLFEVRETIGPTCAALAARRRTEEDLDELAGSTERLAACLEAEPAFMDEYLYWHLLLARISGNEVMRAVMQSCTKGIWKLAGVPTFQAVELKILAVRSHRRVTEAVARQDEEAARRRMLRHVAEFTEAMRAVPGLKDTMADLPPTRRRS